MDLDCRFFLKEWFFIEKNGFTTDIPITDHLQAVRFVKDALASHADYGISIPELAMPKWLLDGLDHDLDCCHPEQWDKLFCTQFALLFPRRCAIAGILKQSNACCGQQ
jgi:hypothetical protein